MKNFFFETYTFTHPGFFHENLEIHFWENDAIIGFFYKNKSFHVWKFWRLLKRSRNVRKK